MNEAFKALRPKRPTQEVSAHCWAHTRLRRQPNTCAILSVVFKSSTKLGMKTLLLLLTLSLPLVSPQCGGLLCSDGRWLSWGPERVCWCYPVGRVCCTDTPSSCAPAPQDCGVGGPYPPLLPLPSFPPLLPSLPLRVGGIRSCCLKESIVKS